jgi:hypothetical protein
MELAMSDALKIFAIYNADATVAGEINYALGKLIGLKQCSLCDISHGWNPLGKTQWRSTDESSPTIQWLHRDQQADLLRAHTQNALPAVVALIGERFETLLDSNDLLELGGDLQAFYALLERRLADF